MAKLTVKRSTVVSIYSLLGFATAKNWNRDTLTKRASKMGEIDLTSVEIKDEALAKEVDEIIAGLKQPDVEIDVVNDFGQKRESEDQATAGAETAKPEAATEAKTEEKVEKKPDAKAAATEKAADNGEASKKRGWHEGRQTAGSICGEVLRRHGLENGITEEMISDYAKLTGKEKLREGEAKGNLAWAAHVIRGYQGALQGAQAN